MRTRDSGRGKTPTHGSRRYDGRFSTPPVPRAEEDRLLLIRVVGFGREWDTGNGCVSLSFGETETRGMRMDVPLKVFDYWHLVMTSVRVGFSGVSLRSVEEESVFPLKLSNSVSFTYGTRIVLKLRMS